MQDHQLGSDPSTHARWFAERLGWPVAQGTWLVGPQRCSCGERSCPCPGTHPLAAEWRFEATVNGRLLAELWGEHPDAGILAPTGIHFDALDVPAAPGQEAVYRLQEMGAELGPVLRSDDRVLLFVGVGARLGAEAIVDTSWRYGSFDVHCRSEGSYVVLPPSAGSSWLIPPTAGDRYPDADGVIGAVLDACLTLQARAVPQRRRYAIPTAS
jgi:hypothetical protein